LKNKNIPLDIRKDIMQTINFLKLHTNKSIIYLLNKFNISRSTYYSIIQRKKLLVSQTKILPFNKLTDYEREAIINYAKYNNGNGSHRVLAYKMIDNNIAYVSKSTVYRLLKENNLIKRHKKRKKYNKYSNRIKKQ